jgi:hypothetical protein
MISPNCKLVTNEGGMTDRYYKSAKENT